MPTSIQIYKSS